MRYVPMIHTSNPELLSGLQPGQWINYEGAKGRYMGRKNGCVWIAWNGTAAKRFHIFARAFRTSAVLVPQSTIFGGSHDRPSYV